MKQPFVYVGLDVDDTQYHGSALDQHTGAVIDFHRRGFGNRNFKRPFCLDEKVPKNLLKGQFLPSAV